MIFFLNKLTQENIATIDSSLFFRQFQVFRPRLRFVGQVLVELLLIMFEFVHFTCVRLRFRDKIKLKLALRSGDEF